MWRLYDGMAVLRHRDGRRWVSVGARTLVGRASYCSLRLDDRRVAGEQALLWYDRGWWVRDLASRNGTSLDGEPLQPGQRASLEEGTRVRFGCEDQIWGVIALGPPGPAAVGADGALRVGVHAMLALPDEEHIEASVIHDGEGWVLDRGERATEAVADQARIEGVGGCWTLLLPANLRGGSIQTEEDERASEVDLAFVVSPDGDEVRESSVVVGGVCRKLVVRTHMHLLVALAEARLEGVRAGQPLAEQGWLDAGVVCRRANLPPELLAKHTYRARCQLARAGVVDVHRLIEVRGQRGRRQLRLGFVGVSIRSG